MRYVTYMISHDTLGKVTRLNFFETEKTLTGRVSQFEFHTQFSVRRETNILFNAHASDLAGSVATALSDGSF